MRWVATAATNSARLVSELSGKVQATPNDAAATLKMMEKISGDADGVAAQGEHAAAQAAMAMQSLFVAYDRNEKLHNSADVRAAISGLFQELQNPSAYDPGRFAARMHQVNALLR